MLEVGGVEDAGGQHHHMGRLLPARGHRLQRRAQHLPVLLHRLHGVVVEQPAARLGHGRPVLDHVGDAAGIAQVVLQHPVAAIGIAHDVDAGDIAVRPVRHRDAHCVALEAPRRHDQPFRHHPVGDRGGVAAVQVVEEAVEGGHPLGESPLEFLPFQRRDQPGKEVHRPDPLGALLVAVDGEGDALAAELVGDETFEPPQFARVELTEPLDDPAVGATDRPVGPEGLVEPLARFVGVEQAAARSRQRISHNRQC